MQRSTDGDAGAELLGRLLEGVDRELPRAVELRRRLHAHPELAHEETWTAETVSAELPAHAQAVAGTGRIARIGPAGPRSVAVRAELDGVPLRERTGAPFSAHGEAMHACGHDVHMAALVALARAAHGLGGSLPVELVAVLQPSEEAYPSGAQLLAQGELAQLAPAAIVAAHVHPQLPWGSAALDDGTVNASCDAFAITVEGEPTHGAYPHLGRDPVLALAEVVVALHAAVGRRIDPMAPASLTVAVLEAGRAENVIPARAVARGALRAYTERDRATLRALVSEVAAGVAAAHGTRAEVVIDPGEPALCNDERIVASGRELLQRAGLALAPPWRSAGSDDFSFLGAVAPLAMAFVGLDGADEFETHPLHHPELLVPDAAVGAVARAQAALFVAAAGLAEEGGR
jgi:amidohydrolase